MGLILLIVLICLILFSLPTWPYSRRWGYGPMGFISILFIILLILIAANVISFRMESDDSGTTIRVERPGY